MGSNDHLEDEAPFNSIEKYICSDCVEDEALEVIVKSNLHSNKCDYCGKESHIPIGAPFDLVMQRIYESIATEYADATDLDLPYQDGKWIHDEIDLRDVVGDFDPGWSDLVIDDVTEALEGDKYWVKHSNGEWAITDPAQTLVFGWENFKRHILFNTRYLFFSEPYDKFDVGRPDYIPVSLMLDALGSVLNRLDVFRAISAGSLFYRVRALKKGKEFSTFEDMGVSPADTVSSGRMNPAGIPYLYVALEKETARAEIITKATVYGEAVFVTKRDLMVVDLGKIKEPPSQFEPELYQQRYETYFLRGFQNDIVEPVSKDSREHIDYVPTQVVSEFLRHRFKDNDGNRIDGVIYPSVKNTGGANLVLFVSDNETAREMMDLEDIKMVHNKT